MALSAAAVTGTAFAQGNAKIERIVVPFAAGGVQDLLARAISTELGVALGQTVIIDNKPGAGGTVGTGFVAKSAPDSGAMVQMPYALQLRESTAAPSTEACGG